MNNFRFCSPTEFIFGRNTETQIAKALKRHGASRVLVVYGGGSVVRSGLLADVELYLQNDLIEYALLGGVQPNPTDELVYKGIALCREKNIDFVLAIGGGSVIDTAKVIAAGVPYRGDFWNFFERKVEVTQALKIGTILTIPAAGSEASDSAVITRREGLLKRGLNSFYFRPAFSILNPELTYSLPAFQTACGIADMMAHVMERYFSNTRGVELTDRLCEAVLAAVIKEAPLVLADPRDYQARANIMWAGTLAHNGLCGLGREEDWASHKLEHELSALYDVAHGAGLAVIFPAWATYVLHTNPAIFEQFAVRVWGITPSGDQRETARAGIQALKDFFVSIGLPVSFEQLGARRQDIDRLLDALQVNTGGQFGGLCRLDMEDARRIYELACEA